MYNVVEKYHFSNRPTPVRDLYSYLFQNIGAAEKEWPFDYGCFEQLWNAGWLLSLNVIIICIVYAESRSWKSLVNAYQKQIFLKQLVVTTVKWWHCTFHQFTFEVFVEVGPLLMNTIFKAKQLVEMNGLSLFSLSTKQAQHTHMCKSCTYACWYHYEDGRLINNQHLLFNHPRLTYQSVVSHSLLYRSPL